MRVRWPIALEDTLAHINLFDLEMQLANIDATTSPKSEACKGVDHMIVDGAINPHT